MQAFGIVADWCGSVEELQTGGILIKHLRKSGKETKAGSHTKKSYKLVPVQRRV